MQLVIERLAAACLMILLLPLFLFLTAIVFIDDPGIPFFTQMRVGKNGKLFSIYKFRTMQGEDDKDSGFCAFLRRERNQYRVTRLGRVMRKYGIDESLQIINIVRGDMRFIGPRPRLPNEALGTYVPVTKNVLPGLTGISQTLPRRFYKHTTLLQHMEETYESRRTILSDAWIWWRTAYALLSGYHE
jgi:lipopolysaccharide/colanic/teichoic acid biosynthesis glycosyltransferase